MYLKRLEIFGFKTFAEKTEILFTPGVTAVIGPNGSGKSNVGDAVLWVLGEQNIRALRGNTSQDVIFAGNERRKPLGMAEVSLTIDNSARILPLEFSEVTVTRRVYRSGEGEFFINRVPCRLRDIYELFLDTGIGRDAYSFVNQSEIDAILSVRAEDRRAIFEEAAGIKKYRVRKREALKKLENTRANLARVNDIIVEIEAQLGPLQRQAQAARRHSELYGRLRELELAWYAATLRRLTMESDRLGGLITDLNTERSRLEKQLEAVRAEEADRRSALHALDVELERLRLEETEQSRQVSQAESQVALLGEREESARRQAEALAAELGELAARGEELKSRGEAATREQAELAAVMRERQAARTTVLEQAAALARELDAARQALDARQAHLVELARRQESKRSQVVNLEGRQRSLAAARARLESEQSEWQTEQARIAAHLQQTKDALQMLEAEAVLAREQLTALTRAAEQQATELKAATAERDRTAGELTAANARRKALTELAASFQGYAEGARAVLNASRKGDLPSGFRPLLDALSVPPGLEAAVEAALGPAAQSVLAPSPEAARQAIELLRRRSAGRATIVFGGEDAAAALECGGLTPLSSTAGAERQVVDRSGPNPVSQEADMASDREKSGVKPPHSKDAPLLLDLIHVDEDALPAVHALIGHVAVVEDLEAAFRAWTPSSEHRTPNTDRPSLVTRAGDLLAANGAITGGREGKNGGSSQALLARRRELDELAATVTGAESRLAEQRERVEAGQRETGELAQQRSALQSEIDQRRFRQEELRRELQRSAADTERIERAAARLAESAAANAKEAEEVAAALEQARAEAGATAFDNSALEAEIEAARRALDERQTDVRAMEREAADARVEVAALEEKARSAGANVRRLTEGATSVERQLRAKRDQAAALAAEREALARQKSGALAEVERQRQNLTALQEVAETRRGERAGHADQLEGATAHLRELSERAGELLQRAHRAEVERTASETERTHLVGQLFSDYEIAPEELPQGGVRREASGVSETDPDGTLSEAHASHLTPDASEIARLRRQLKALGPVNPEAVEEYDRLSERYTFLTGQRDDLELAQGQIHEAIREIDATTRETFMRAFKEIGAAFDEMFQRLFGGGRTELVLTDPSDVLETGIEIIVQPPGKKLQNLLLLSGGERALTASAMLFALLKVRPSPFCVLDEVDAPLDEANVGRFSDLLREFAQRSQFVIVTHNRGTMEAADTLYGVTMDEPGISRLVSVRLDDVAAERNEQDEERLHFLSRR
jgi:chromosome segregation protein